MGAVGVGLGLDQLGSESYIDYNQLGYSVCHDVVVVVFQLSCICHDVVVFVVMS